jgi:hypothetical protein
LNETRGGCPPRPRHWPPPEAELVNPLGVVSEGQAAIVEEHVGLWAGNFKGSHVMMVDFHLELTGVREPPPGSPRMPPAC